MFLFLKTHENFAPSLKSFLFIVALYQVHGSTFGPNIKKGQRKLDPSCAGAKPKKPGSSISCVLRY